MSDTNESREIRIQRLYDAPLQAVWDAWTDPAQAALWWGPRGYTLTTHSKDVRTGGHWDYTMHGPDGTDYPNTTQYLEVLPLAKLVYDHGGNADQPPMFRVTVLFDEVDGKTRMDMSMRLPTAEAAAQTRVFIKQAGGNATWDRLAEYLAKRLADQVAGRRQRHLGPAGRIPGQAPGGPGTLRHQPQLRGAAGADVRDVDPARAHRQLDRAHRMRDALYPRRRARRRRRVLQHEQPGRHHVRSDALRGNPQSGPHRLHPAILRRARKPRAPPNGADLAGNHAHDRRAERGRPAPHARDADLGSSRRCDGGRTGHLHRRSWRHDARLDRLLRQARSRARRASVILAGSTPANGQLRAIVIARGPANEAAKGPLHFRN